MKLEEIEKLCEEATPGPWETSYDQDYGEVFGIDKEYDYRDHHVNRLIVSKGSSEYGDQYGIKKESDARFIAASRELVPKLLAVVKAAIELDLRYLPCDEKLENGWNTVTVLEHYDTCRKCAFLNAFKELEKE